MPFVHAELHGSRGMISGRIQIIGLQSNVGHALMLHYRLDPTDPVAWLYLQQGHGYSSLDAFIRVGLRLGRR